MKHPGELFTGVLLYPPWAAACSVDCAQRGVVSLVFEGPSCGPGKKKVPVVCDFCRSAVCRRCAVSAAPGVGYFCKCAGSHAETELGRLSAARRRRSGFCFLSFCCLAKSCASRLRRLFSAAASRSWCSWSCTYQLGCINAPCPVGEFRRRGWCRLNIGSRLSGLDRKRPTVDRFSWISLAGALPEPVPCEFTTELVG